jgi:hypothetical protein
MANNAKRWWDANPLELASSVWQMTQHLDHTSRTRRDNNDILSHLYANNGTTAYSFAGSTSSFLLTNRITYNVCAMVTDTLVSKIGKIQPKMSFLTSNGRWADKNNAQKLERYISGQFWANEVYSLGKQVFKDSLICDIGIAKHYVSGDRIVSERIHPNEIYTDEVDSLYGKPTHFYQVKHVSKSYLKKEYPNLAIQIDASNFSLSLGKQMSARTETDDFVTVVEAWRLPSKNNNGKLNKDGKHVISTSHCVLYEETWVHEWAPFTFMKWNQRQLGFFGQSLNEELVPFQLEISKLIKDIQTSYNMLLAPKVFIPNGSKIPESHIDNDIGTIIKGSAKPELIFNQQIMPSEAYSHLKWLIQSSFERAGITQLSATGKKPAGLDAAVALREYQDIESERFAAVQQEYEKWYVDTAKIYIALSDELRNPVVRFAGKGFSEEIDFRKIDLDASKYVMRIWPSNMLPDTPAGQIQMLKELMEIGFVDITGAAALLDFPDTNGYMTLRNAEWDFYHKLIQKMVEDGFYESPDPSMNLDLGMQLMQQHYSLFKLEEVEDDKLELIRTWLATAQAIMKQAQQSAEQIVAGGAIENGQPALNTEGIPINTALGRS